MHVPSFVRITRVVDDDASDASHVVTNEATGRYFLANGPTVALLDAINRTGNLPAALRQTGISADHAKAVIDHLIGYGVVVQRGVTQQSAAPKAPLESKMIALAV